MTFSYNCFVKCFLAGYSGAEVVPGTEPAAGPIQSQAAIGWR